MTCWRLDTSKPGKQESHQPEKYGPAIIIIIIIKYSSTLSTQGSTPGRGRLNWQYHTSDSGHPLEAHNLTGERDKQVPDDRHKH